MTIEDGPGGTVFTPTDGTRTSKVSHDRGGSSLTDLSPEAAVVALTRELPNYAERIVHDVGGPVSELWGLVLVVSGRMSYPAAELAVSESVKLGIPEASLRPDLTRFELWEGALSRVLEILGDPEARYRTGYDSAQLGIALHNSSGRAARPNLAIGGSVDQGAPGPFAT